MVRNKTNDNAEQFFKHRRYLEASENSMKIEQWPLLGLAVKGKAMYTS